MVCCGVVLPSGILLVCGVLLRCGIAIARSIAGKVTGVGLPVQIDQRAVGLTVGAHQCAIGLGVEVDGRALALLGLASGDKDGCGSQDRRDGGAACPRASLDG
jgi:hypothetical protein